MAAASKTICNFERVCSDLTVLASLKSKQGQEQKLVYSQSEGLYSENAGYWRSLISGYNRFASTLKLDSGYSRDIIDLTPIMANIYQYCDSEEVALLSPDKLKDLAGKIVFATDGLVEHMKKYLGQEDKEKVISNAIDSLTASYHLVDLQMSKFEAQVVQDKASSKTLPGGVPPAEEPRSSVFSATKSVLDALDALKMVIGKDQQSSTS